MNDTEFTNGQIKTTSDSMTVNEAICTLASQWHRCDKLSKSLTVPFDDEGNVVVVVPFRRQGQGLNIRTIYPDGTTFVVKSLTVLKCGVVVGLANGRIEEYGSEA